jgi:pyruvate formate lyase activating enzyme
MRVGLQKTSLIDYPGKLASVFFLPGCNLRCPFCHNPGLVEPARYPEMEEGLVELDEAFAYAQKRKNVIEAVVISGGEPCLSPELPEILKKVKSLGLLVKLDTNGLFTERLAGLDADFVAMDLKTSLGRYREIPGASPDAEEKIRRTMEYLRQAGISREFRTTLAPGFARLDDVLSIANELRESEDYVIQRFRPGMTLDPAFGENQASSESDCAAILEAVKKVHPQTRLR